MELIEAFGELWFSGSWAFVYGLALGSFLNVCIYRMPRGLSVIRPASACPACGAQIRPYDNIPVFSWLWLRGKCRYCKHPISPRYMMVELLTALIFLLSVGVFGPSLTALKFCVFGFLLIGLVFTDAEHKLLPDAFTLPGLAVGLVFSLLVALDGPVSLILAFNIASLPVPDLLWRLLSLGESVVGASVGALFIWAAGAIYKKLRGVEGMGFGDVKLMAMVGAFLGVKLTLFTLMLGSVSGALAGSLAVLVVYAKRRARRRRAGEPAGKAKERAWASAQLVMRHYEMPFGVFLGGAGLIAGFFGQPLVSWYFGLF